ncbi:hypothetical protein HK102_011005, partial [Quaeritorhiza haematococci]
SSGVDPVIQGLAAYLLGICYEFNDDEGDAGFTRASLQHLIVSRIGVDVYISRLERLKESKAFNKVSPYLQVGTDVDKNGLPDIYFDYAFVDLFKSTYETIMRNVTTPQPKGGASSLKKSKDNLLEDAQEKSIIQSYKELISSQDKELAVLRKKIAEMEKKMVEESTSHTSQIQSLTTTLQSLQSTLSSQSSKYDALEKEQEDLLVCLAEQDLRVK